MRGYVFVGINVAYECQSGLETRPYGGRRFRTWDGKYSYRIALGNLESLLVFWALFQDMLQSGNLFAHFVLAAVYVE